ncbi:MAG: sugar phosphate isomerase/epimerase [Akkermansiaceae bacterium]|jgi:sugar phosphate isomerase/epimerase|nr:sugar phosphate isomerase/epimerase [Akkermansiaceae bacterium]MDP4645589.1 sugar phosphate isomerase/epimerase [Akkermansiaceae bacterium]MDP4719952.1 sugar phosphate isomerase/epimerase [Akkermansiaceae bacterium]MDP4779781.1 sugar phosphate isomerase/epimerase [Akkermansiaceae bacterium]MDP4846575.1 sugar phosphate isomerase/epimerase [Akkermansiaceae bacterium]
MKFTGFADEASRDLSQQIAATQEIGWSAISTRTIGGKNIHEIPEDEFQAAADQLDAAGITVPEFGSLIGNWAKPISSDFAITLAEIERAIPRMHRLGTKLIRIMSYAQEPWGQDQHEQERFRRLREIVSRFSDSGITALHENCMNWGGFSPEHTLRLVEEVPGLKLIFDTGNPVFQKNRSKPSPDGTFPWQDSFEFWEKTREHTAHIHIKDCLNPVSDDVEPEYVMPGLGQAKVREILADAKSLGYDGWIAIEPHVATVFHAADPTAVDWTQCYDSYVEYGKNLEKLTSGI